MTQQLTYGHGGNIRAIRVAIVRGGTSKGIYIMRNDLPSDEKERDKVILRLFGSPDLRQIDGLGGANILTSKVAIIGPPTHKDADVDYLFGQVAINLHGVDYSANCGNLPPRSPRSPSSAASWSHRRPWRPFASTWSTWGR